MSRPRDTIVKTQPIECLTILDAVFPLTSIHNTALVGLKKASECISLEN